MPVSMAEDNVIPGPWDNVEDDERLRRIIAMAEQDGVEILTDDEAAEYEAATAPENRGDASMHYANLADFVEENVLDRLATDVIEWVERDEASRADWYARERKGIELMGLIDDTKWVAPFKGASQAVHPLIAEACTNFQARAIAELWPAGGPVKSVVMGYVTPEREAQAQRVAGFMNYQYTSVIDGFDEEDRMLMRLPMSGSCFKKHYFDPVRNQVRSDYCEGADILVPYQASSLESTPRYTHRMRMGGNEIRKHVNAGWYRDVGEAYNTPLDEGMDLTDVHVAIDEAEGRAPIEYEEDGTYRILECVCDLDLKGFEHKGVTGRNTGIGLPYVVTVDADNQRVLAIRRQWRKNDPTMRRRVQMTHYKFLPGLGFYGYGFIHIIGGLGRAATGALRSMLDAAGFANMRGGFRSRDAKLKTDEPIGMGEWRDTDMTAEELAKCFYPIDYKEPSPAMYQMLGHLDELGRRFATTTENMTGEANNNGPVGTTLALIEQGMKVFSAIHKRSHEAHAHEFRCMADLYAEFMPERYPYLVEGSEQFVLRADFDERVDVLPVSDPNIVSNTQRIARAQGVNELATQNPDLYDRYEVQHNMLTAMQVPNIDVLLPPPQETPRADPVSENVAMTTGSPVKAFPDQDHYSHMLVHRMWWERAVADDMRPDLEPVYKAHMAEHMALWYQAQMMMEMGGAYDPAMAEDPAVEAQLAQQAALVTQLMAPPPLALAGPEKGGDGMVDTLAEQQRKDIEAKADIDRKDAMTMAQIDRDDAKAAAEIERAAERELEAAAREEVRTRAELDRMEREQ